MALTSPSALKDLRSLSKRAHTFSFDEESSLSADRPREAAVLVLFGESGATSISEPASNPADILLLRRSSRLSHHPGQVAFPGGGREEIDRNLTDTALREAEEETGLSPSNVMVLGELSRVLLPNSNNLVTPVLGWWNESESLRADGTETASLSLVQVETLLDPSSRFTAVLHRDGGVFEGPMFQLGPEFGDVPLWGFTAGILDRIFDELGWTIPWDKDRKFEIQVNH